MVVAVGDASAGPLLVSLCVWVEGRSADCSCWCVHAAGVRPSGPGKDEGCLQTVGKPFRAEEQEGQGCE